MLTGEGTPLNILQSNVQSVRDYAHSTSLSAKNDSSDASGREGLSDLVELSKEARNFLDNSRNLLKSLVEGQQDLSQQEKDFIGARLEQVQEQVEFLRNLLSVASSDQAETILKGLQDAGNTLQSIGRQLGLIEGPQQVENSQTNVEIQAINISASFNQVAVYQNENGDTYSVSQSLEIDFSFLQISVSRQSVTEGQENAVLAAAQEGGQGNSANALFLAQLNNASSQKKDASSAPSRVASIFEAADSSSSNSRANSGIETVEKFSQVVHSLTQTIEEYEKFFNDEERVPPSLYSIIKNLVSSTLESKLAKDEVEKVDKVA